MPVHTVKSLQDATDLKYISEIGRIPKFVQTASEDAKLSQGRAIDPVLIDNIANYGLAQLWHEFKLPVKVEKRKRRHPLPFHPLLGMN